MKSKYITHTYIHTYIHTYTHAYIKTYVRTQIHTCIYIHTQNRFVVFYIHIHAYIHTYTHTYIHTHTYTKQVRGLYVPAPHRDFRLAICAQLPSCHCPSARLRRRRYRQVCVLLLQNVFSYYRMCSLTILLGFAVAAIASCLSERVRVCCMAVEVCHTVSALRVSAA